MGNIKILVLVSSPITQKMLGGWGLRCCISALMITVGSMLLNR